MQSGISASQELKIAFQDLLSSSTSRGLLASISKSPEQLVPLETISSTSSDFSSDLSNLEPHVKDNVALYILLRENMEGGAGQCVAVTYVPEKAPVRQKMLFASSRLTLVRELGTEHFTQTPFATSPSELTASGWSRYLASQSSTSPLTTEEAQLAAIKDAEAQESRGTSARSGGHVSKGVTLPIEDDAAAALDQLKNGQVILVQLGIDISREMLVLAGTEGGDLDAKDVGGKIATDAPRYTFYRHADSGSVIFIYTCPSASKIKERMLYAASRLSMVKGLAPAHGIELKGNLEATDGIEVGGEDILKALGLEANGGSTESASSAPPTRQGFAKPKRPGRR